MPELYNKHRPKKFKQVKGQKEAVQVLSDMVKKRNVHHALLFTGPSGCGKTTLTRILGAKIGCASHNYKEYNVASYGGIDLVRSIEDKYKSYPMGSRSKVYVLDEAHELTRAAQEAILKILEDCPKFTYFMLCTTQPEDLIKTIQTRVMEIKVNPLDEKE
jgi:DNA polymerase-3 subunit gamma/tau